ncbi:hypothetical protein B0J13DRAFT_207065 [Dactylonectria estremocensis]|uniref:Uncharacterized protein n=1 Tax=Dactylonectria estremocensis TaxID=1079267 RepID=A0A9P9DB64_9HYPO|nr:hypothetical protein B0J13DRAFT_207065 [Dactylonectria estremocensis]
MKRTTVHQCVLLVLMQQLFARRASKLAFAWALLSSSVGGSVTGFPAPCSCNGASNIQHTLSGRFSAASGMIFGCFFYSTNLLRLLRLAPNKVWPAFVSSATMATAYPLLSPIIRSFLTERKQIG